MKYGLSINNKIRTISPVDKLVDNFTPVDNYSRRGEVVESSTSQMLF
jgi:hypothetical protein